MRIPVLPKYFAGRTFLARVLASAVHSLVAVLAFVAASPQASAADVTATTDTSGTGYTDSRKIVRNPTTGRLFAAYRALRTINGDPNFHVFVSYSDDNGASWSVCNGGNPIDNIGDSKHRTPSLAIDSANTLHIVWYGNDSTTSNSSEMEIKYSRSKDSCASWINTKFLTNYKGYPGNGYWQEHPVLLSYGNFLYVAWQGRDSNDLAHSQIRFLRSQDRGKTWDPIRILNTGMPAKSSFTRPAVIATGSFDSPTLVVVSPMFLDSGTTTGRLMWTTSTDGGASFPNGWAKVCSKCTGDQRHVSISSDSAGRVHIVWREGPVPGVPQIYYSRFTGTSWFTPIQVSSSPQYQFSPQIEVDQAYSDTVRVIWSETNDDSGYPSEDPETGYVRIASKTATSKVFNPSLQISTNGAEVYPVLRRTTATAEGQLDVLWTYVPANPVDSSAPYPIQHMQLSRSR